jgi:fused signal recognition particle receptor
VFLTLRKFTLLWVLDVFDRLKSGLGKTRKRLTDGLQTVFNRKVIDQNILESIETQLLSADVGVQVTAQVIDELKSSKGKHDVFGTLKAKLVQLLLPSEEPLLIDANKRPFVILVVGVNGSGKTTTIGKLAKLLQQQSKKVMLAAGDTFRAAAVEQLQIWGQRNDIQVVSQQQGADSAAVIFDALQSAKAKNMDVLIADTAGRLHTQSHLMEELKKIKRVMAKLDEGAPHEVLLVLDACIGQNAVQQAKQFNEAIHVTGIVLTKLDGTAKGGIIFSIASDLGIPIRLIGVGEQIDDLQPFQAEQFVNALFGRVDEK